jgi:hypothetical protein
MAIVAAALNTLLYARNPHNATKYRRVFGRFPDLVAPRLYSEKLQWRKLFDRNPLFPLFLDKLKASTYVAERAPMLRIPKVLWSGKSADEIPYADLPDRYVIKPNHRSGCNYFVSTKEHVRPDLIAQKSRLWLSHPEGRSDGQWGYQEIEGRLFVEEMLNTDEEREHSRDYRFHVFSGRVALIVVEFGQIAGPKRKVLPADSFYDRDWTLLPHRRIREEVTKAAPVPRPDRLGDMVGSAEALGQGIDYLRIDMFAIGGDIWFGEITVYPGSGFNRYAVEETPRVMHTENLDVQLGRIWQLPQVSMRDMILRGILG